MISRKVKTLVEGLTPHFDENPQALYTLRTCTLTGN